jgi:phosphopantothenoylcysteine decarboxylase/phosphopantothenate--cysteine ligase
MPMNILLAVSGSIAAYKAYDLTRSLVKKNHTVRVMITHGALEFVKPEVFRYLGAETCYLPTDDFNSPTAGVPHIDIGKWADKLVLAPASANTIARLARGEAGDFLASLFLAWRRNKPMLIFPAMNTMMWSHEFTQDNIQKLEKLNFLKVIDPASGLLACGDEGAGKLMEVEAMSDLIEVYDDALEPNVCNFLIDFFESNPDLQEIINNDGKPNFTQLNLTENCKISEEISCLVMIGSKLYSELFFNILTRLSNISVISSK